MPDLTFGVTTLPWGKAWWLPDERAIVLDTSLTRPERRQYLTHELVHAEAGDQNCALWGRDGARLARRREREVDAVVAERLLPLPRLADALTWALGPDEVAAELDVTEHMVLVRVRGLSPLEKQTIEQIIERTEGAA